jgi:hypothetical protein
MRQKPNPFGESVLDQKVTALLEGDVPSGVGNPTMTQPSGGGKHGNRKKKNKKRRGGAAVGENINKEQESLEMNTSMAERVDRLLGLGSARPTRSGVSEMASMTSRHFRRIAEIISTIKDEDERRRIAGMFADELRSTNPNFDRNRFLSACGVEPSEAAW